MKGYITMTVTFPHWWNRVSFLWRVLWSTEIGDVDRTVVLSQAFDEKIVITFTTIESWEYWKQFAAGVAR